MGVRRKNLVSFVYKHYIVAESIKKPTTITALLAFAVKERYNPEDK